MTICQICGPLLGPPILVTLKKLPRNKYDNCAIIWFSNLKIINVSKDHFRALVEHVTLKNLARDPFRIEYGSRSKKGHLQGAFYVTVCQGKKIEKKFKFS